MALQLQDGTGASYLASINKENQLKTVAESQTMEHFHAREFGRVFVMPVTYELDGSGVIVHMRNDSQVRNVVFHEVYIQAIGLTSGTTLPDTGTYVLSEFGTTRSSGGTLITAANTRRDRGLASDTTIYRDPTVSGTGEELTRWYPKTDGDWIKNKKEEAFSLGFNDTFQLRLVTDHTSGVIQCHIKFSEIDFSLE